MLEYFSIKQRFMIGAAFFILALLLVNSYQMAEYKHKVEVAKTFVRSDAEFTAQSGKIEKLRIVRQRLEEDVLPKRITFTFHLRAEKGRFEADVRVQEDDNGDWRVTHFTLKPLQTSPPTAASE
jgi:hypothetical protein